MTPILKEAFRKQRTVVFGNKRFLLHMAMWGVVLCIAFLQSYSFNKQTLSDLASDFTAQEQPIVKNKSFTVSYGASSAPALIPVVSATGEGRFTLSRPDIYRSILFAALLAAIMVYFFLLLVIPWSRYRQQRRVLLLGVSINIVVYIAYAFVYGSYISGFAISGNLTESDKTMAIVCSTLIIVIAAPIITFYFFAAYYFIDLYDQQKSLNRYKEVLGETLQAETNFLKMQINPHFLFNTLNNIYSLSLARSGDAAVISSKLKDLVQYILQDSAQEMVSLKGEISFLENYVSLEKLRNKQENVTIEFNVNGEVGAQQIAPMLLINFIENAFKHGVKAGIEHAFVKISINVLGRVLYMDVVNSIPPAYSGPELAIKQEGGIGIRNVKRRMEILYAGNHTLKVIQSKDRYKVSLSVVL